LHYKAFGQGLGLLFIVIVMMTGCAGGGDAGNPKKAVSQLFGAMDRDDRAGIAHLLDLPQLMNITDEDYALQREEPRVFHNPEDILDDLTGEGVTKNRWFSMQRVLGSAEMHGDTAYVEVSFIDKSTNVQYYNKFGLHKVEGRWKIFSFKTIDG